MLFRRLARTAVPSVAVASRFCATSAAPAATSNRKMQRDNLPRGYYPPSYNMYRHDSEAIEKGFVLRVQYLDECVSLNYLPQLSKDTPKTNNREKISLILPTTFIARFLAVLNGSTKQCDIATRSTQGVFSAKDDGSFVLSCNSQVGSEKITWDVTFTAADAIIFNRFMEKCLQYNQGFFQTQ